LSARMAATLLRRSRGQVTKRRLEECFVCI